MKKNILKIFLVSMTVIVVTILLGIPISAAGKAYGKAGSATTVNTALSADEITWLTYMREEEKMARDVYLTMYDLYQEPVFQNIAESEQRHMDAVEKLLDKYGIADPVTDNSIGAFTNETLQTMYTDLVAQGSASLNEAYLIGVAIEEADITDLNEAIAVSGHTDIIRVYTNLLRGSNNHLNAFNSHLE